MPATSRWMSSETKRIKQITRPVTKAEERRAKEASVAALTDRAGGSPRGRFRVLWAELRIDKPERRGALPLRRVAVVIVDYDHKRSVEFLVDTRGTVVGERALTYSLPFAADEVVHARRLAERDSRVERILTAGGSFDGTFHPGSRPEARLVGLRYALDRRRHQFRLLGGVVVDLYEERVVSFDDPQAREGR